MWQVLARFSSNFFYRLNIMLRYVLSTIGSVLQHPSAETASLQLQYRIKRCPVVYDACESNILVCL
jgi:hypothetical protein